MTTTAVPQNSADVRRTRILIVDDHPIVRQGLRMLIEAQPRLAVCGEAARSDQALQLCGELRPDLVIVDLSLEDGNGVELVRELAAVDPRPQILVCSMHDERLFAERVLRAGAGGYLSKLAPPTAVIDAIERVAAGGVYLSQDLAEGSPGRASAAGEETPLAGLQTLSDRELQVFELIGRGITTRRIAENLGLSPKTIETYRENIKHKLGLANAVELTRRAVHWVLESA